MRKRPLLLGACVFVAGLCFGRYGGWVFSVVFAGLLGYANARLIKQKKWKRMAGRSLWLLFVFSAAVLHMRTELSFREQELLQITDGREIVIRGEIYKKEEKTYQNIYYLKDVTVVLSNQNIACNHVMIALAGDSYSIGESLTCSGKVKMFDTARNEGNFDAAAFYASQKIDFSVEDAVVLSSDGRKDWAAEELYGFRKRISRVYDEAVKPEYAGILSVMLLGEKSNLDSETKTLYQQVGISHILAISGLHVSLIGMGVYRFLRKRGFRYGTAFATATVFLIGYVTMTGNGVSTRRACGMLVISMFADVLGRSYDSLNALGLMTIVLLWENPFLLGYAGFIFSVAAILGIVVTGTLFTPLPEQEGKPTWKETLEKALYGSLGVWMTSIPLAAYFYYEIPVYSMLLNLLVIPLLSCLFFFGILGGLSGLLWIPAAKLLLLPCRAILCIYGVLADGTMCLPYASLIVGKPSAEKMLCFYLLLGILCYALYRKRQGHKLRIAGIVLLLFLFFRTPERGFEVDVLDVGQGDGIYLCTEDGSSVFIDGGSSSVKKVETYRILPFLKSKGISHMDYWFVSHVDEDHISGLREVLESGYEVDNLVLSKSSVFMDDEAVSSLMELAEAHQTQIITIEAGEILKFRESEMICLSPEGEEPLQYKSSDGSAGTADRNDLSLVLIYRDAEVAGMFPGDISREVEQKLLEEGVCGNVDFYKAAHHGSGYSNSADFLRVLQPEIAVISCGRNNIYGHPAQEAVSNMEEAGAVIFQTMEDGQVQIRKSAKGCHVLLPCAKMEL